MGARTKLNAAHINGCLLVSAAVGTVTRSWTAFLLTFAVSAAAAVHAGGIRSRPAAGPGPQAGRTKRGR